VSRSPDARRPAAAVEDLLAGRYRLQSRIAVGGMGEVWRADDTVLSRPVAVKTLKSEYVDDPDFRARFRAEARSAARLSHPGIASVHDYGEEPDRAWLVMELVDGEPLSAILRRERSLRPDRVLDLLAQTATALHAAHAGGVVHRDVKPGNLLVRPDGVLKVTDFGIASVADAVPLTRTGIVVGTAYYLSPEQAAGRGVTGQSDLYSLGVVGYECLAGRRLFPGDSPVAVAMAHLHQPPPRLPDTVPAGVRDLIARALAKDPAERPRDGAAFAAEAHALRTGLVGQAAIPALPVEPPPAVRPPGAAETTSLIALPREAPDAAPTSGSARVPAGRARSAVRRSAVGLALAVLAVVAVVLGARALTGGDPGGPVTDVDTAVDTAVPAQPPPAPVTVQVDPARYVGRPLADVDRELAALGLVPRAAYDGAGTAAGTVSGVEPAGALAPGTGVTVHVAPAPAPAPPPAAPAAPPPPPAPAPVAPAAEPAPADPAPAGKGNAGGKGGGNGGGNSGGKGKK
jgi:tRNA A-37 threonylcarbamoyl transferase component Bud32